MAGLTLSGPDIPAWAPEGRKDEVKRPQGPPARSRGPEGPWTFSILYFQLCNKGRWSLEGSYFFLLFIYLFILFYSYFHILFFHVLYSQLCTLGVWSWEGSYFFTLSDSSSILAHFRFTIITKFSPSFWPGFDLIFFADPILVQDSSKAYACVLW